jgi:hypothetical protein
MDGVPDSEYWCPREHSMDQFRLMTPRFRITIPIFFRGEAMKRLSKSEKTKELIADASGN